MKEILLLKLDHGSGYVGYYNKVSLAQLNDFIRKRGCCRLIFRWDNEIYEMNYRDFKNFLTKC